MRGKTTPQTQKHTKTSSSEQSGLIAKERSAEAKHVLDNHSHRTRTRDATWPWRVPRSRDEMCFHSAPHCTRAALPRQRHVPAT